MPTEGRERLTLSSRRLCPQPWVIALPVPVLRSAPRRAVTRAIAREVMVRTPLFARILSQFWLFDTVLRDRAPAPELRNTDDEAMLFCEVRFPLTAGEARVAVVLDGIEGFEREEDGEPRWRWFAAGSPLWWDRLKSATPALRRAVFDGRGRDEIGCQPLPSKVPP